MSSAKECPFHFTWCPRLPEDCPSPVLTPTPSPRPSPNLGRFTRITPPLLLPPSPRLSAEKDLALLPLPFLLGTKELEKKEDVESNPSSRTSSAPPPSTCSHHHPNLPSASRSVPPPSTDSARSNSSISSESRVSTPSISVQDVLASEDFLSLYTNEEPTPFVDDSYDNITSPPSSSSCPSDSLLFMDPSNLRLPPQQIPSPSPPPPSFNFDFDASCAYDSPPPAFTESPTYLNVRSASNAQVAEPRPDSPAEHSLGGGEMLGEETAFISKLWHLINHPEYSRYVRWSTDGKGIAFVESELEEFASRVLPRFFRSSKIESLIRQINLYSFSRTVIQYQRPDMLDPSISVSVSCSGYSHPDFQREHPGNLKLLHPKVAARKATSRAGIAKKKAARKLREEAMKRGGVKKSSTPR
ncbi:HSF-type DNA-binding-domain-containing protein [Mrakia frigida]|uniref:heat shock factor family protein n=1 Tax=Mrakia frigida TaxID=29902 RepID=UPI003FCC208C